MSQLIKHYWLNRDTLDYAVTPASGYMVPNIEGLNKVYDFVTEDNVYYSLSTVPDEIVVEETVGEGLKIITQQEWDNIIIEFDNRQQEKRYNILREIRDEILKITDWIVIRDLEQQETISQEFKTWRQALRDFPNRVEFPSSFPTLPTELETHTKIQELYSRFGEVSQIYMVNDPLSSQ